MTKIGSDFVEILKCPDLTHHKYQPCSSELNSAEVTPYSPPQPHQRNDLAEVAPKAITTNYTDEEVIWDQI